MKQSDKPFEELIIPRRDLQISESTLYRVYRDYKTFELVEASSALEALSISGMRDVYKVLRHNPLGDNVIHLNREVQPAVSQNFSIPIENVSGEQSLEQKTDSETATQEQVVAASQIAADAPLNNDDIDKLLNG